jgi:hypothetical protein
METCIEADVYVVSVCSHGTLLERAELSRDVTSVRNLTHRGSNPCREVEPNNRCRRRITAACVVDFNPN